MEYSDKRFLSDRANETGAMVCTLAVDNGDWDDEDYVEAEIQVRDCYNKPICLDFNFNRKKDKERKQKVKKVQVMIDMLEKFKKQLEEC